MPGPAARQEERTQSNASSFRTSKVLLHQTQGSREACVVRHKPHRRNRPDRPDRPERHLNAQHPS